MSSSSERQFNGLRFAFHTCMPTAPARGTFLSECERVIADSKIRQSARHRWRRPDSLRLQLWEYCCLMKIHEFATLGMRNLPANKHAKHQKRNILMMSSLQLRATARHPQFLVPRPLCLRIAYGSRLYHCQGSKNPVRTKRWDCLWSRRSAKVLGSWMHKRLAPNNDS